MKQVAVLFYALFLNRRYPLHLQTEPTRPFAPQKGGFGEEKYHIIDYRSTFALEKLIRNPKP